MTSPSLPKAFTPFAEPTRKVRAPWIALFATAWFGIWMAQLTPVQLLLPTQVDDIVNPTDWTESVVAFGIVSGIAGVFALITYPLTGALSDRTTSRFGRRRPWIVIGAVLFEQNDEWQTSSRYMMVEAFAQIDKEEIDPILSITTKAA